MNCHYCNTPITEFFVWIVDDDGDLIEVPIPEYSDPDATIFCSDGCGEAHES